MAGECVCVLLLLLLVRLLRRLMALPWKCAVGPWPLMAADSPACRV